MTAVDTNGGNNANPASDAALVKARVDAEIASARAQMEAERAKAKAQAEIEKVKAEAEIAKMRADALRFGFAPVSDPVSDRRRYGKTAG